jgi:phospholipid transport system substrate-binding protein
MTMIEHCRRRVLWLLAVLAFSMSQFTIALADASDDPSEVVEKTVNELLDEFIAKREHLEGNNKELFALVDRIASPLFDFNYISRLVLAKSWKKASEEQRLQFSEEFKNLIIVTYATALFRYTGDETMEFGETGIKERKGVKFGTVNTEVTISGGAPIPVVYSLIKKPDESWKIYNLTVGDLNLVLNYRNVIQSTIHNEGLDGMIASMKENNDKFN